MLQRQKSSSDSNHTGDVVVREEVVQRARTNDSRGSRNDEVRVVRHLGNFSNILSTSLFTRLLWCSGDACSCTCLSARPRHISSPVRASSTSTISVPMVLSSIVVYHPAPREGPQPV